MLTPDEKQRGGQRAAAVDLLGALLDEGAERRDACPRADHDYGDIGDVEGEVEGRVAGSDGDLYVVTVIELGEIRGRGAEMAFARVEFRGCVEDGVGKGADVRGVEWGRGDGVLSGAERWKHGEKGGEGEGDAGILVEEGEDTEAFVGDLGIGEGSEG